MSEASSMQTALSQGPTPSFTRLAVRYLLEYQQKIHTGVTHLDEEQIWWRANATSNSVGNLLLHLSGNLSMWILATIGGRPFERHRSEEFAARGGHLRSDLLARLDGVIDDCIQVVEGLSDADLSTPANVQGYSTNALGALFHAVEHTSYHTGQILLLVKALTADTGFELYPQHRGE